MRRKQRAKHSFENERYEGSWDKFHVKDKRKDLCRWKKDVRTWLKGQHLTNCSFEHQWVSSRPAGYTIYELTTKVAANFSTRLRRKHSWGLSYTAFRKRPGTKKRKKLDQTCVLHQCFLRGSLLSRLQKDNIVLLLPPHVVSMQDAHFIRVCNLGETSSVWHFKQERPRLKMSPLFQLAGMKAVYDDSAL